jgi:hypothetical protein
LDVTVPENDDRPRAAPWTDLAEQLLEDLGLGSTGIELAKDLQIQDGRRRRRRSQTPKVFRDGSDRKKRLEIGRHHNVQVASKAVRELAGLSRHSFKLGTHERRGTLPHLLELGEYCFVLLHGASVMFSPSSIIGVALKRCQGNVALPLPARFASVTPLEGR